MSEKESSKMGLLSGANGEKSSKRIAGLFLLVIGVGFLSVLAYKSYSLIVPGAETIIKVSNSMLFMGGGLLGLGIFERFKK